MKVLQKKVQNETDQQVYEGGHGPYSGTWGEKNGLQILDKVFTSYDDAYDYVSEHNEKWGPLTAVKIAVAKVYPNKNEAKMKKVKEKIYEMEVLLGKHWHKRDEAYETKVVQRIQSGKSKFKTCPSCDSKIATKHIRSPSCPVCQEKNVFYTTTDALTLGRYAEKLIKLQDELTRLEKEGTVTPDYTGDWQWYVGGWCSC